MAGPGSQARGFHSGGRLGRGSSSKTTNGGTKVNTALGFSAGVPAGQAALSADIAKNVFGPNATRTGPKTGGLTTRAERGSKPGEDAQAIAQTKVKYGVASDVEKAVIEAQRQRALQSGALDATQTVLGLMPAPGLSTAFGLGRWMGRKTEEDAAANPENYRTDLKDPGSLYSKSGPVSTNRAVVGPAAKTTEASAGKEENLKKKKQALPTLLGAPAQALGTFSNPVQIT